MPLFLHLKKEDKSIHYFTKLLWTLSGFTYIKYFLQCLAHSKHTVVLAVSTICICITYLLPYFSKMVKALKILSVYYMTGTVLSTSFKKKISFSPHNALTREVLFLYPFHSLRDREQQVSERDRLWTKSIWFQILCPLPPFYVVIYRGIDEARKWGHNLVVDMTATRKGHG